jgi:large subunit ribosomal protein L30
MTDRKRIVVVRVRGQSNVQYGIANTLKLMHLTHTNHCTIIDNRKEYAGMLQKAKDYITWGELSPETFEKLLTGRGIVTGGKKLTDEHMKAVGCGTIKKFASEFMKFKSEFADAEGLKPVFRLSPPAKGYDRGGIKHPYTLGGALGYRGEKINELIERMI